MFYKKILVVCGSGIATSTVVASRLREEIHRRGVENVIIKQGSISSLVGSVGNYDLLVTVTEFEFAGRVPMVKGLPILTGKDKDQVIDEILIKLGLA